MIFIHASWNFRSISAFLGFGMEVQSKRTGHARGDVVTACVVMDTADSHWVVSIGLVTTGNG